ncbi:hypothetical protein BD310DRAFT_914583 [Dichomitus squalens]|uniref:Uncharacterized protein n=1 Tax=Dichomitus squalens TaxID=114155 RepID=A0A4Q9QCH8_9APHY|nr:hypothetical protein BD310DRAFT_914583 [Dichomitus squalens]
MYIARETYRSGLPMTIAVLAAARAVSGGTEIPAAGVCDQSLCRRLYARGKQIMDRGAFPHGRFTRCVREFRC